MSDQYTALRTAYVEAFGKTDYASLDYAERVARNAEVSSLSTFARLVVVAHEEMQRDGNAERLRALNESHQQMAQAEREALTPYQKLIMANRSGK
ncbi:MAG: hypothetical protein AAGD43_07980 [Pseudomonadota bacterium]